MRRALVMLGGIAVIACSGCATGITGSPSAISGTSAIVAGSFATDTGGTVETWFQYGPTTAYGSETEHHTQTVAAGPFEGGMGAAITGLQRSTVYHYRACASDSKQKGGPGCGADRRFKTQPVDCGDTVTTDIRLVADLGACTTDFALKVGADGVDINLGGHAIRGELGPASGPFLGIVNDGHDDVTVHNGTLSNFSTAYQATGASRNVLRNVTGGIAVGASFTGGADNEIRHSEVLGTNSGVHAKDSARLVIADSHIQAALFDAGALIDSDDVRIVRNHFDPPLTFAGRLPALRLTGNRAHISNNVVSGLWASGFVLAGSDNVVADNQLSGLFGNGIFVSPFSSGVLLRGNHADGMTGNGIDVQASGTRLRDNSATNNDLWGIDAVPGVSDLGGNTASGNGQAGQCRNVACN